MIDDLNILGCSEEDSYDDLVFKNGKLLYAALATQEKLKNLTKQYEYMQNENELEKKSIIQQLDKISINYEKYAQSYIKVKQLQSENDILRQKLSIKDSDSHTNKHDEYISLILNEFSSLLGEIKTFNDNYVTGELFKQTHLNLNFYIKKGFDCIYRYSKSIENGATKIPSIISSSNNSRPLTPLKIYKMNGLNGEVKSTTYRRSNYSTMYSSKKISKANSARGSKNNSANHSFVGIE